MKIRASQINGCAYCLDMHAKEARAAIAVTLISSRARNCRCC
ncbi:carboxymuconolactone decarboxylase family protein [Arthrobacter alpinus]|nr:carboxymuconolactone decarboxylase family protein [Arthrobacter alpinus]